MGFDRDKGVEGVALMCKFQNFPINSLTFLRFHVAKGGYFNV